MNENQAPRVGGAAVSLRRTHAHAPVLDILDLALQGHADMAFPIADVHPRTAFGQLIAEAFDNAMSPGDWHAWTGPRADPVLSSALLKIWETYVLPRFVSRYGTRIA